MTYELLGCAHHGHRLIGQDTARIRPEDAMVVRERDGLRWHRCLRCDGWVPLPPPEAPGREYLPEPDEVDVPLRAAAARRTRNARSTPAGPRWRGCCPAPRASDQLARSAISRPLRGFGVK